MKKLIDSFEKYSPSVLRYAMSAVILWFGIQQLMNGPLWTAYVPDSAVSLLRVSALTLVYFNGAFEVIFGLLLVLGIQTRIAALLLSLHLFDIMYVVGYGEIGVRDFGLAAATFAVFMNGPDLLCLQGRKSELDPAMAGPRNMR